MIYSEIREAIAGSPQADIRPVLNELPTLANSQSMSNWLVDSLEVTQSRVTELKPDCVLQSRCSDFPASSLRCPSCELWQRWANTSEQAMLNIEAKLIEREKVLQEKMKKMKRELDEKAEQTKVKVHEYEINRIRDQKIIQALNHKISELMARSSTHASAFTPGKSGSKIIQKQVWASGEHSNQNNISVEKQSGSASSTETIKKQNRASEISKAQTTEKTCTSAVDKVAGEFKKKLSYNVSSTYKCEQKKQEAGLKIISHQAITKNSISNSETRLEESMHSTSIHKQHDAQKKYSVAAQSRGQNESQLEHRGRDCQLTRRLQQNREQQTISSEDQNREKQSYFGNRECQNLTVVTDKLKVDNFKSVEPSISPLEHSEVLSEYSECLEQKARDQISGQLTKTNYLSPFNSVSRNHTTNKNNNNNIYSGVKINLQTAYQAHQGMNSAQSALKDLLNSQSYKAAEFRLQHTQSYTISGKNAPLVNDTPLRNYSPLLKSVSIPDDSWDTTAPNNAPVLNNSLISHDSPLARNSPTPLTRNTPLINNAPGSTDTAGLKNTLLSTSNPLLNDSSLPEGPLLQCDVPLQYDAQVPGNVFLVRNAQMKKNSQMSNNPLNSNNPQKSNDAQMPRNAQLRKNFASKNDAQLSNNTLLPNNAPALNNSHHESLYPEYSSQPTGTISQQAQNKTSSASVRSNRLEPMSRLQRISSVENNQSQSWQHEQSSMKSSPGAYPQTQDYANREQAKTTQPEASKPITQSGRNSRSQLLESRQLSSISKSGHFSAVSRHEQSQHQAILSASRQNARELESQSVGSVKGPRNYLPVDSQAQPTTEVVPSSDPQSKRNLQSKESSRLGPEWHLKPQQLKQQYRNSTSGPGTLKTIKLNNNQLTVQKNRLHQSPTQCSFPQDARSKTTYISKMPGYQMSIATHENERNQEYGETGNPEHRSEGNYSESRSREEFLKAKRLQFENQNLREYQKVLLQKLSNTRPRKY